MADSLKDTQQALQRTQQGLDKAAQDFLRQASKLIGGQATSNYMRQAKGEGPRRRIDVGPLRLVTGRLARSLIGSRYTATSDAFRNQDFTMGTGRGFNQAPFSPRRTNVAGLSEEIERIEKVGAGRFRLRKGSKVPYAGIHEHGGLIKITPRMRSFFWAKWYETENSMWRAMALTTQTHIRIQARPYLEPALDDVRPRLQAMAGEMFTVYIQTTLEA